MLGNSPTTPRSEITEEIDYITDKFIRIDMGALRSHSRGVCIPPGYVVPVPEGGTTTPPTAEDEVHVSHRCMLENGSDEVCGLMFANKCKLVKTPPPVDF